MENEIELQKVYVTPIIPGMKQTTIIAHFGSFGLIESCNTTLYETCVQYANVDSAKLAMSTKHCIEGHNMTIRWKPHILDLNPLCLIEVFEYCGIDDLCCLKRTCDKFKEIAEKVFILKFANEVFINTSNIRHPTNVPHFDTYERASGMLKNFRHLIKSIRLEHEHSVSYKLHPAVMIPIIDLIRDKFSDFSDMFFREQSASSTERPSNLKNCTFMKIGIDRVANFLNRGGGNRKVSHTYFFNVTDGTFIQKLKDMNMIANTIFICVNDRLPPETIPQLCEYTPDIEYLALYQNGETNFDISALTSLKHLKVLNLSLSNATAESLKSLLDLNVTIEGLLIRGAIVDNLFVSSIRKLAQLKALVLTGDTLFDENRLAQIVGALPKLVTLVVDKKLSIGGLKKIVKECPSLSALEIEDLHLPFKFEKLKKCFITLKRLYLTSPNTQISVYVRSQSQCNIFLSQSIPVFNYMFQNIEENFDH